MKKGPIELGPFSLWLLGVVLIKSDDRFNTY